jgi:CP family cyanate transporter-like MFS transporter
MPDRALHPPSVSPRVSPVLLAAGTLLIAANFRPAITVVGPLIGDIRHTTGLSATAAGLLTSLPLLVFGAVSPLAAQVGQRFGIERALLGALAVLVVGMVLRSSGPVSAIFAGTMVLGAGIGIGNVLLPALLKQDFAKQAGPMTALYSSVLVGMAGVGAAVSVPLADTIGLGWRGSLVSWSALGVVTLAIWWPYARCSRHVPSTYGGGKLRLWRSLLAWQVTLFMGLQSVLFFSLVAWLPTLLQERGMTLTGAGWMVGLMQIMSLGTTMVVPTIAGRRTSQQGFVLLSSLTCLASLGGMWIGISPVALWVVGLGLGYGGLLGLALMFFVLRAPDARHSAALAGMAQSVGFLLAATGPVGLGFLHDITDSWNPPLQALMIVVIGLLLVGLGAARALQVEGRLPT